MSSLKAIKIALLASFSMLFLTRLSAATCLDISGTYLFQLGCQSVESREFVDYLRFPDPETYRVGGNAFIEKGSKVQIKQNGCQQLKISFRQNNLSYSATMTAGKIDLSGSSHFETKFSSSAVEAEFYSKAFVKKVGTNQDTWKFQLDGQKNIKIKFTEVEDNTFGYSKKSYQCVFKKQ